MLNRIILLFLSFIFFVSCSPTFPDDVEKAYKTLPDAIDFNLHVKPILADRCFSCHGPDKRGSKLYRRAMHTIRKRSVPNPTQSTFDVGIRSGCIVRRQNTNTPLQALIILNDPAFVEAAKVIGEHIAEARNNREGLIQAFRKLTGRMPADKELDLLMDLQSKQYQVFKTNKQKTIGWMKSGAYKLHSTSDPAKVAANAVVASAIINMDAAITKR